MRHILLTAGLLILMGFAVPSYADQCCCAASSGSVSVCGCSLDEGGCAAVLCEVPGSTTPTVALNASFSFEAPSLAVYDIIIGLEPIVPAPQKIEAPLSEDDSPPPPLFVNPSFCFLPPPAL